MKSKGVVGRVFSNSIKRALVAEHSVGCQLPGPAYSSGTAVGFRSAGQDTGRVRRGAE